MITNVLFLNQAAGPLFYEMATDLAENFSETSELVTGHPDTIRKRHFDNKLSITPSIAVNRRSRFHKLLSWFFYSMSICRRLAFLRQDTIIFFASNPPILGLFVGVIARMRNLRYVVLVYDLHPDISIRMGLLGESGLIAKCWRFVNRVTWERADAVITIGDVMASILEEQFRSSATKLGKVAVLKPWADHEFIKPQPKDTNPVAIELGQVDKFTVLYSGNMGKSHDMESMLYAASSLSGIDEINFLFIGEGEKWEWVNEFVTENKLSNCQVLPFQPEARLPYSLALADVSLVSLDEGAEGLMVPSKVFYYLAAGSAVIGVCSGANDLADCIEHAEAGVVVEPGSPDKLASTILELYEDRELCRRYQRSARQSSVLDFSRKVAAEKLVSIFRELEIFRIQQ